MKRLALHTWFLYLFSVWKEIRINKWDHTLTKDHTLYLFAAEPNWTYKGFKKTPSHYADSKQTWRSYLTWYWQLESRYFFFFFSSLVGPIFFYFILFYLRTSDLLCWSACNTRHCPDLGWKKHCLMLWLTPTSQGAKSLECLLGLTSTDPDWLWIMAVI